MSLITYIEPVNVGTILTGIGGLIIVGISAWFLFRVFRALIGLIEIVYNKETRYEIIEEKFLNDIAKEKGINLDEELIKRDILSKKRESIRSRIEKEMFERMFPEKKKDK